MHFGVARFRRLLFVSCASYAVTNLMDLTDAIIAGRLLGETALGAIGLFWPVAEMLCFISTSLASGTAIRYSDAVGKFDRGRADTLFSCGLVASFAIGALVAACLLLFREPCFRFFGATPETLALLAPYWSWFALNAALVPVSTFLATLVCADGGGRVCTLAFTAELVVNVVSSYFLCIAFGTAGCALGTVAGTSASLAVLCAHFLSRGNSLHFNRAHSPGVALRAIATDFPESCYLLFTGVMYVIMNKMLVMRFGDTALPVMSAVIAANGLMYFFYGVSKAAQPILGVYWGERNIPAVRTVVGDAVRWAVFLGLALGVAVFAFPQVPVSLVGIDSPEIGAAARLAVRIVSVSFVFFSVSSLFTSFWLFVGHGRISITLVVLQELVCPTAGCCVGVCAAGMTGFWTGYMLASPLALLIVFGILAANPAMRREMPFLLSRERDARIFSWEIRSLDAQEACRVAQEVMRTLRGFEECRRHCARAAMIVEDTLVSLCERNAGRKVDAQVVLDLNEGARICFRDGGEGAACEDAAASMENFRSSLLGRLGVQGRSREIVTTGFNRHVIEL